MVSKFWIFSNLNWAPISRFQGGWFSSQLESPRQTYFDRQTHIPSIAFREMWWFCQHCPFAWSAAWSDHFLWSSVMITIMKWRNHILYLWHFSCFPLVWNIQNLQMLQQSDQTPYLGWVFLVPQWFTNQATDAASLAAFKDVPRISELETCESRGICWVDISGDMHKKKCIKIPMFSKIHVSKDDSPS